MVIKSGRLLFYIGLAIFAGVIAFSHIEETGALVYGAGLVSGMLLIIASLREQYPFGPSPIIQSRLALGIWSITIGMMLGGGANQLSAYYQSGWLQLLMFVWLGLGWWLARINPSLKYGFLDVISYRYDATLGRFVKFTDSKSSTDVNLDDRAKPKD